MDTKYRAQIDITDEGTHWVFWSSHWSLLGEESLGDAQVIMLNAQTKLKSTECRIVKSNDGFKTLEVVE